jgi:putative nucleotidyltransferase with HDIG domain
VVKALILLVPVAAGTVAGMAVAGAVTVPSGIGARVAWFSLVLATSTLVLMLVERLMRRLAPLALLLRMGLVFPDQAPKRFGIALRAIRPGKRATKGDGEAEAEAGASLSLLASLLAHDRRTRGHSERVAAYARMICDELGVDPDERDRITWGALLHDIGKLDVPARILNKPGALDDAEWRIMAGHPAFGATLVDPLRPWLGDALTAVDGHHERFDGMGYPYRRPSGDLPAAARVVALADAFETMTAARSYKEPMSIAEARAEVAACAGAHFDPQVCRAFLSLSVPRLWRVAGPLSWIAQVPIIGLVARGEVVPAAFGTAAQSAAAATTQAVAAAAVVGGTLVTAGVTGHLDPNPPTPVVALETAHHQAAESASGATNGTEADGGAALSDLAISDGTATDDAGSTGRDGAGHGGRRDQGGRNDVGRTGSGGQGHGRDQGDVTDVDDDGQGRGGGSGGGQGSGQGGGGDVDHGGQGPGGPGSGQRSVADAAGGPGPGSGGAGGSGGSGSGQGHGPSGPTA